MKTEEKVVEKPKETPDIPMKIVEQSVDGNITVVRRLVPADTRDEDTPMGSRLLNEMETAGRMNRSFEPETFNRGDSVRSAAEPTLTGSVLARMKSGKLQVKWENGKIDRHEEKELRRFY